ncbi:MAG: hypothetical protein GF387_03055 [Candidatus Portnoybacteria bacterium]|nr:hypothetical protein [Candidatus Portnoybacteria bacterium]
MKITPIKIIFATEILTLFLVVFHILPKEASLTLLAILLIYFIFSSLEDSTTLFIASIPIFISLAITENFDSLSTARLLIIVLFLKYLITKRKEITNCIKKLSFKSILKNHRIELFTILFFTTLILSILAAPHTIEAAKKVIYLINLVLIFPVIKSIIKDKKTLKRTIKAILISGLIVFIIGLGQLISVYFLNIGEFWDWWADHFSYGFYGQNLQKIVKNMNAWFTHSPLGPSVIRLFGSFTDPHSFGLYLLLIIPFIIYLLFPKTEKLRKHRIPKKYSIYWLWLLTTLFFIVLTGTRGIWLTSAAAIMGIIILAFLKLNKEKILTFILLITIMFISLIPISSIYTTVPQFQEKNTKDIDTSLILKRLTSIIDLEEESNQGRIYIWKQSLNTLKNNWLIGIGIGNFPLVIDLPVEMRKAGATAHNLYLNFAVESGIFSLIFLCLIFLEILITAIMLLKRKMTYKMRALITGIAIFIFWVFAYSLFDIALLDERVFLLFLTTTALIYSIKQNPQLLNE